MKNVPWTATIEAVNYNGIMHFVSCDSDEAREILMREISQREGLDYAGPINDALKDTVLEGLQLGLIPDGTALRAALAVDFPEDATGHHAPGEGIFGG